MKEFQDLKLSESKYEFFHFSDGNYEYFFIKFLEIFL